VGTEIEGLLDGLLGAGVIAQGQAGDPIQVVDQQFPRLDVTPFSQVFAVMARFPCEWVNDLAPEDQR
jgi:hypothetical protein